jgi:metal-sulfur cluster biosynthetic enzyme
MVTEAPVLTPAAPSGAASREAVLARLWQALKEVPDPEIPVSVVDMGLVVSLDYEVPTRTVFIQLTFTAMACPSAEFIQDDIRARLLRDPAVDVVDIQVVWDPVWTRARLSQAARETMRSLGISS